MNTFLSEWREKPNEGVELTMPDCVLASELLQQLHTACAAAAARGDDAEAEWQLDLQLKLREMLQQKLDGATAHFLQRADEYSTGKTEIIACVPGHLCRFGLWVNMKNPRLKSIEYTDLQASCELPKSLALASVAVRVTHLHVDLLTPYDAATDGSNAFVTLGGVFSIQLLGLPPAAKKVKGWTLRPVTELTSNVQRLPYPIPPAGADAAAAAAAVGTAPPLRLSYPVPAHVLLPETVQVGWWDAEGGAWRTEGVSQVSFDTETRVVSFMSTRLVSLAVVQPASIEFPYRNWLITPIDLVSCSLVLRTQRHTVHFELSAAGCTLLQPRLPELEPLLDTPMTPTTLLLRLRDCGINLCPVDGDTAQLSHAQLVPKERELERELHAMLVTLLPRYQLAPSKWNSSLGESKTLVRLAVKKVEDLDLDAEIGGEGAKAEDEFAKSDPHWPTMIFARRYVALSKALDTDAECNEAPRDGHVAHSTPFECVVIDDPDLRLELNMSSRIYQDNVRQLLDQLRLFSFTPLA